MVRTRARARTGSSEARVWARLAPRWRAKRDGVFGWLGWSVGVFAVGEVGLGGEVEVGFAEASGVAHERVGVGVELGDAAATQRDQNRLLSVLVFGGVPPVGELGAHGRGGVVGDGDAAALLFEEDVGVDVALAQCGEGVDFFGVELAAVAWQLEGAVAVADGAERASGLDLGQLMRVTDPNELAAGSGDVFGQALIGAGADHAGLVDQEHGAGRQGLAVVEVGQQAGGVQRGDAGCCSRVRVARLLVDVPRTGCPAAAKAATATRSA